MNSIHEFLGLFPFHFKLFIIVNFCAHIKYNIIMKALKGDVMKNIEVLERLIKKIMG